MNLLSSMLSIPKTIFLGAWGIIRRRFSKRTRKTMVTPLRVDDNEVAIVFVHGFSGNALKTWGDFPKYLSAEQGLLGWDIFSYEYATSLFRFETPRLWSADPDIERLALGLKTAAALPPLNQYKSLAFIGHSMGGLVVQEALLEVPSLAFEKQLAQRTSHVILFGTPSGGLEKASFGSFKPQVKDMGMGPTGFVQRVRSRWDTYFKTRPEDMDDNHPFTFLVAAGDQDEFVPATSSLYPFHERYRRVIPGDHLSIVKPSEASHSAVQLVLEAFCNNTSSISALDSARVAVEMRDFRRAIQLFKSHPGELDKPALVQYALALDGIGRREEAIEVLTEHGKTHSDALGTLGGRLKRRWRVERREADATEALGFYEEGYQLAIVQQNLSQVYYHAINAAFMNLLFRRDTAAANEWAKRSLNACQAADNDTSIWRLATKGECLLIAGKNEEALAHYREALEKGGNPWKLRSAYEQAYQVARYLDQEEACVELQQLFGLPIPF